MKRVTYGGWLSLLLAVGCSGRLNVGEPTGSGGTGGTGGGDMEPFSGGSTGVGGSSGIGGSSGENSGPVPGTLGESCISGGVAVEASGTPAEAEVATLVRCDVGLFCNADNHCEETPPCTTVTDHECVVYAPSGAGGSGGSGGSAGGGGVAGRPSNEIGDDGRVRALAADDTHLYWVDYGTRDELGNHQGDGALMALTFSDGTTTTIASELDGPVQVGVTSTHAFIEVDGAGFIGDAVEPQLLRVPLAGGASEFVQELTQDGLCPHCFTAAGSQAFWSANEQTYSMLPEQPEPSVLLPETTFSLAADELKLFYGFWDGVEQMIWSVSLDGSEPTPLLPLMETFSLGGDFFYRSEGIDDSTGVLLSRAPKEGGSWERVRALGHGSPRSKTQIVGDRFFMDESLPWEGYASQMAPMGVMTGFIDSTDPPVRILERLTRTWPIDQLWVGTSSALYWSDGQKIYKRGLE